MLVLFMSIKVMELINIDLDEANVFAA